MARIKIIKKNRDFLRIYNRGVAVTNRSLVLYMSGKKEQEKRFGFSVSKKVGKAVVRNRVKRLLKEACRQNIDFFPDGKDYILVAKKEVVNEDFHSLSRGIQQLLPRLFKKNEHFRRFSGGKATD